MIKENYEETYEKESINDDIVSAAIEKYMTSYGCITPAKEADVRVTNIRKLEELAYIDEMIQTCIKYKKVSFALLNPSRDAIEVLRSKGYQVTEIEDPRCPWDSFYRVFFR